MFQPGDFIVCGSNGVCKVEEIGTMDFPGVSKNRIYYTLTPVYSDKSKVYIPTDNQKVIMRPIISKEEAWKLVDQIMNIETMWIDDEKRREYAYKESLKKCDCMEWVRIIKTLHLRKKVRMEAGKKGMQCDEKYLRIAEDNLYGELAIPLGMERDMVEPFITERIKTLQGLQ